LGVTPSAWRTSEYKAVQVGIGASFYGRVTAGDEDKAGFSANAFYDQTDNRWEYIATDSASRYDQLGGGHFWFTAASGTAGNAITFTQALTLDASGNLSLGTTSVYNSSRMSILAAGGSGGIVLSVQNNNDTYYPANFRNSSGTSVGNISCTVSATAYNTSSDYRLKNITGPITTSGAYIDSLNPVEGTWKADGSTFVGLIAHEVQEASRTQVATGTKDGAEMQAMDYSSAELIANLIAEVKSLRQRVATLEAQ
jgi:hypothetical protein